MTPSGCTRLPPVMLTDMGLDRGGFVWFFRSPSNRWEAWLEGELDEVLGGRLS